MTCEILVFVRTFKCTFPEMKSRFVTGPDVSRINWRYIMNCKMAARDQFSPRHELYPEKRCEVGICGPLKGSNAISMTFDGCLGVVCWRERVRVYDWIWKAPPSTLEGTDKARASIII